MSHKKNTKEITEKDKKRVYIYHDQNGVVHTTTQKYFIKD